MSRRVLITGISRGIGVEAARMLLDEGYEVTGTYNQSEIPENLRRNKKLIALQVNLGDRKSVEKLKPLIIQKPAFDVLVNNAGIFKPVDFSGSDQDWDAIWDETQEVNLRAPAMICKWAVQSWRETGMRGIVINVSSRAAYRGETAEYPGYAASKAGMTALTKTIARGFGKEGIVAYTIAPGFVKTDMAMESIDVYGEEYLTKDLALNGIVPASEVGRLITTLARGDLRHMTGSTLHMNSGSYMI